MKKIKNVIKFHNRKAWLTKDSPSAPSATGGILPDWYKKASRYVQGPDGKDIIDPMMGGKMPNWKACPAMYDVLTTGYLLKTPCDIEVTIKNGRPKLKMTDSNFDDFLQERDVLPGFPTPPGFSKYHFAFYSDWSSQVPEGYSTLYVHPLNRYDLPFIVTNGIIDNDTVFMPGSMPFFIQEGWEGIIPAGTPYSQLIPFKREDWSSEILSKSPLQIHKDKSDATRKFRVPGGGVYLKDVWQRRKYE